jgi:hypothetical protein
MTNEYLFNSARSLTKIPFFLLYRGLIIRDISDNLHYWSITFSLWQCYEHTFLFNDVLSSYKYFTRLPKKKVTEVSVKCGLTEKIKKLIFFYNLMNSPHIPVATVATERNSDTHESLLAL